MPPKSAEPLATGFASIDGTSGFDRVGQEIQFVGLFRHRDSFGRVYFEVTEETANAILEDHQLEEDNVTPAYFDDYWKVWMVRGRLNKMIPNHDNFVARIDNHLLHEVKGHVYKMAEGSVIDGKPYSGSYFVVEEAKQSKTQPKAVIEASQKYIKEKAAELTNQSGSKKSTKSGSKKKSNKAKKSPAKKKAKAKRKAKLVEDEAEDEDGEDEEQEEEMEDE